MKRKSAVRLCLAAGLVLLTAQLSLLFLLLYPYEKEQRYTSEDIQSVVNITKIIQKRLGLSLLCIDSEVLTFYLSHKNKPLDQCIFCSGKQPMTFAILLHGVNDNAHINRELSHEFKKSGFHSEFFLNIFPVEIAPDLPVNTTICYVLQKGLILLHVVMFHEREGNFWWHGDIQSDPDAASKLSIMGLSLHSFATMKTEGAFDKFNTQLVDLNEFRLLVPENIPNFLRDSASSRYRECNHKRANSFHHTFGKDTTHDALRFTHRSWKLLSRVKTLLNKLQVRFWLSSGTCLGYFRQCDIIPYSRDVDIGIFITDYTDQLVPEFLAHGFSLKHWFGQVNDSLELSFISGDIKLDMFFFYEEGQWLWNGGTQAKTGKKFKYLFPRFKLCWTQFLELKVRVPCETEAYVEANYGTNWFTPVSTWDWKTSPANVKENGLWPSEEWSKVIQVYT